ncbi:MAG: ABC transporter substrate-binding protein [Actinomycetota bacterium]|nr:ABC transporter substrate-binding protein [Actinomycetota bacterium]
MSRLSVPLRSRTARTTAFALAGLSAAAALAGCSGTEAADDSESSGEVTLMMYSGVVQDNYTEAVVEPFMEKYPDITVNYVPAESSSEMLASLRAEKGNPSTDVAVMDVSVAATGNEEGIFQPLDPEKVTNLANIDERGRVDGNFGPAVTFDNLVLLYNTDEVAESPTSWDALWSNEAAGEVAIDAAPDIQGLSLMMITNKMEGADYTQTVEPAVERLEELAPNVQTWAPNPDSYTMVTNGSATTGIGWNARAQFYSDESDGNLGVSIPEEGSVFQINTINLTEGSDSPEAAQTFIDYALSPEAQAAFAEQMYYAPTNTETELSPEVRERTATTPERLSQMLDVDWSYVAEKNDEWTEIWRRQILGS